LHHEGYREARSRVGAAFYSSLPCLLRFACISLFAILPKNDYGDDDDDDLLSLLIGVSVLSRTNASKKETTIQAM